VSIPKDLGGISVQRKLVNRPLKKASSLKIKDEEKFKEKLSELNLECEEVDEDFLIIKKTEDNEEHFSKLD
jgi:hypothetical protein